MTLLIHFKNLSIMRNNMLLRLFTVLMILGISISSVQAQQKQGSSQPMVQQSYPDALPGFHIGLKGGYLLKNNDLSKNPAFYLNQGYFGELNAGWRSKNNWLGWNLSLGRLNLERKIPTIQTNNVPLSSFDLLKSTTPGWMFDSIQQDQGDFHLDTLMKLQKDKKNLQSWYAMTGPEFWFGKHRLQGFVSLNAGVGMTNFGYYTIKASGFPAMPRDMYLYDYYSQSNDKVIGQVNTYLGDAPVQYEQYSMNKKAYADYKASKEINKTEINFMARAAVGIEYFITPKFSIDASASYWYIMTPDLASAKEYKGFIGFRGKANATGALKKDDYFTPTPGGGGAIIGQRVPFDLTQNFEKKALGLISANIGIKYWLGKSKKPVEQPEPMAPPIKETVEQPEVQKKNLLITVKDGPTGYALSGVKVTVYKDGETFYTGMTDANGSIPKVDNLIPGDYKIQGILNGIKTDIAHINRSDFEGNGRVITRELTHKDLRFTLVGHTLDAATDANLSHIKTTLTESRGGENSSQVSDNNGEFRYQLDPKSDFTVIAQQKGYFSNREKVSTKGLDRSKTLYVDLRLTVNELKEGASFELKNIYYDFDKSNIRADAAKVLNDVYKMMTNNPTIVIELSSYTDSRGSDSYNMKLSQERASSAVAYLVQKGIAASRLVAKGYGETDPVNGCINGVPCTDEQHQANRRTEIKILKK